MSFLLERIFGRSHDQRQQQQQQPYAPQQPVIVTVPLSNLVDTFNIPEDLHAYVWALRQGDCVLSYLDGEQIRLLMTYVRIIQIAKTSFIPASSHPEILSIAWGVSKNIVDLAQTSLLALCRSMRGYQGFTMRVTRGMVQ